MRWHKFTAKKYPKHGKYFVCVGKNWRMYSGRACPIENWEYEGKSYESEPAVEYNGIRTLVRDILNASLVDYWAYVNINPLLELVKRDPQFVNCKPDVVGEQFVVYEEEMSDKRWQEQFKRYQRLHKDTGA